MNYLGHAFLSNNNSHLLVGNFIADHLKGNDFSNYTPEVIEGIYLHRKIDAFTDANSNFKASKRIFYSNFERYSGILIDIYFDYFLAKNFNQYSHVPLKVFCENAYKIYSENTLLLPKSSIHFLNYVLENNIYFNYASIKGIEKVLFHLSHRIKHGVMLNESIHILKKHEAELENNFELFFEDAIKTFL